MTSINSKINQLFQKGKYDSALIHLKKQIKKAPNDSELERLIGVTLMHLKRLKIAEKHLKKSHTINPESIPTLLNLASLYREQGRFNNAVSSITKVLEKEPHHIAALFNLGNTYRLMEKWDDACTYYLKVLKLNPNHLQSLTTLALLKKNSGLIEESINYFKKALTIDPFNKSIYLSMANLKNYLFSEDEIDTITTIINQSKDTQSVELLFAKAQYLEHTKKYEEAYSYLKRANQAHCQRINHASFDWSSYTNRIINVFDKQETNAIKSSGNNTHPQPVFIVSMPRSGSTLVEQIIASHSSVFGASELTTFPELIEQTEQQTRKKFPDCWVGINHDKLKKIAKVYESKITSYGTNYVYISDKNLDNFNYIGAILSSMPNSLFIHCTRHPMDICLSCYKQLFNFGQTYSYDIDELAAYYLHHEKIMNFWKSQFPKQILTINYENLVHDIEPNVARILNFLKLPWQDACLDFHKTKRVIRTASAAQVTQKIYKTANHRYKKYGSTLKHLENCLESVL